MEFCKTNNLFILNGRLDLESPKLTCKNASTVDYRMSSANNFPIISSFEVLEFDALYSDVHCQLAIQIDIRNVPPEPKLEKSQSNGLEIKLLDDSKKNILSQT